MRIRRTDPHKRPHSHMALVTLLAVVLGLLSWATPSSAVTADVTLADTNDEWARGSFLATGLTNEAVGGVQLLPAGVVKSWNAAISKLPVPLVSHATVHYRDRLFVVGGATLDPNNPNSVVKGKFFFSAQVTGLTDGQLGAWTRYDNDAQHPGRALPKALTNPSALVVEAAGRVYLYVMGGEQRLIVGNNQDIGEVTSSAIYRTDITPAADGSIVPGDWQTVMDASGKGLPQLPDFTGQTTGFGGGASRMASVVHVIGGTPYIYLFGGRNTTKSIYSSSFQDLWLSDIYRAAVNAGGSLGAWERMGDIKVNMYGVEQIEAREGAVATLFHHPETNEELVYLTFGKTSKTQLSRTTAVAKFNADGTFTWLPSGTSPYAVEGHGAIVANGAIYAAGGNKDAASPQPTADYEFAALQSDGSLNQPPIDAPPGVNTFTPFSGALLNARLYHTMEAVPTEVNGTWVYVLGGRKAYTCSGQTCIAQATDEIFIGQVGVDSDVVTTVNEFQPAGIYYSKVFDEGPGARYEQLTWVSRLSVGQSIQLAYRAGNDPNNLGAFQPLAATTVNGTTSIDLPAGTEGRYLQFRATFAIPLDQRTSSPVLDRVTARIYRVGFPNLKVNSASINGGAIRALDPIAPITTIANQPYTDPVTKISYPALDADFVSKGTFFVFMYVTPPGQPDRMPALGDRPVAYAQVDKALLKANAAPISIAPENWIPWCSQDICSGSVDWRSIFNTIGTYTVHVMVDGVDNTSQPNGNVEETETGSLPGTLGETDNIATFTVSVDSQLWRIYLPITQR